MSRKAIISAAITGGIHTPTMSPYLPITQTEIAQNAIDAARAGAACVHVHARDPKNGMPTSDLNIFGEIIDRIKSEVDVIICTSTGGGVGMTVEQRVAIVSNSRPELASFNMGSINFGLFPLASKYRDWKFAWERPYLEGTRDFVFRNTFQDLEEICKLMRESGTKPELEIYDVGHLYNLEYLVSKDLLKPPIYLQFVTGVLGSIQSTIYDLVHLKSTADRLFGENQYRWSAFGAGRMQYAMCTTAVLLGGNCRVGMEDSLYISKNELAKSNAEQVEKMVRIMNEFQIEPASPREARVMLGMQKD
jgi:uncharacterized protein (DUF849 family)